MHSPIKILENLKVKRITTYSSYFNKAKVRLHLAEKTDEGTMWLSILEGTQQKSVFSLVQQFLFPSVSIARPWSREHSKSLQFNLLPMNLTKTILTVNILSNLVTSELALHHIGADIMNTLWFARCIYTHRVSKERWASRPSKGSPGDWKPHWNVFINHTEINSEEHSSNNLKINLWEILLCWIAQSGKAEKLNHRDLVLQHKCAILYQSSLI